MEQDFNWIIDEAQLIELHSKKNYPALVAMLKKLAQDDLGKTQLWKYRAIYRNLPEDEINRSPLICATLALLAVLSDDVRGADTYVARLRQMQLAHRVRSEAYGEIENYLQCLEIMLPHRGGKNIYATLKTLNAISGKHGGPKLRMSLTCNRPSIINGGRDFTAYGKYIPKIKRTLKTLAKAFYGESSSGMVETAIAELLYQQDQLHDSLVLVVSTIPFIERGGQPSILFVAMYTQFQIMIASGQLPSTGPMLDEMRQRILEAKAYYLIPNLEALGVWSALYDNDYHRIDEWMINDAPKDLGELCTLDRFQYFVKLRAYLMREKHFSMVALAERLRPVLLDFQRQMELCEMNLLLAMSYFSQGEQEMAFSLLDEALPMAEKYRWDRTIADEGAKMYLLLREYARVRGDAPYLSRVMKMAHRMGLLYPDYLKPRREHLEPLTPAELEVLRLMAAERTNAEIADYLGITVRTVKFHSANLYQKLSVKNRSQAVKIAKNAGII